MESTPTKGELNPTSNPLGDQTNPADTEGRIRAQIVPRCLANSRPANRRFCTAFASRTQVCVLRQSSTTWLAQHSLRSLHSPFGSGKAWLTTVSAIQIQFFALECVSQVPFPYALATHSPSHPGTCPPTHGTAILCAGQERFIPLHSPSRSCGTIPHRRRIPCS